MKTYYSDQHIRHNPASEFFRGRLVPPFEKPERMEMILARLRSDALGDILEPQNFGMDPVCAVHDPTYLSFLETCWTEWKDAGYGGDAMAAFWPTRRLDTSNIPVDISGKMGWFGMGTDTSICEGTWAAALASKDVALAATQAVLDGDPAAFGLCRPPGHHAARDQYCGYCFLNNAAIAAQFARDRGKSRVAIFDVDFHHGNGTQDIFYDRDDVLFLSIHGAPETSYPYFLGYAAECGTGPGEGYNVNFPLPPGTPYGDWRRALVAGLDRVAAFAPELLIISLGVDTFENDPISTFKLVSDDFTDMGQTIAQASLPTVFLMEGGYAVDDIGINVANVLNGFEAP